MSLASLARPAAGTPLRLALALALGSAALLAGAWWFQLGMGLWPCKLCLQQRWPHYAAVPLAIAVAAAQAAGARWPARLGWGLLTALLLGSAALGAYHAGVEWGWFAGPNDCGGAAAPLAASMQDFMRQLETTRVVSCTEAAWRFGGLSLAGWNALISLGMAAAAAAGLARSWR